MKKVDSFTISLILLILISASLIVVVFKPLEKKSSLFPPQIDKIEISYQQATTQLEKENGSWVVKNQSNLPADPDKIEQLLDSIRQINKDQLVSENSSYHDQYGVSQQDTIQLIISGQNQEKSIFIGNPGPGFTGTYFRFKGEEKVFLTTASLRSILTSQEWRDLRITTFLSDQVKEISVNQKKYPKIDDEKVRNLINSLTGLYAQDVTKGTTTNQGFKIKLITETEEINLNFFEKEEGKFLTREGKDFVYQLSEAGAERINQAISNLEQNNL